MTDLLFSSVCNGKKHIVHMWACVTVMRFDVEGDRRLCSICGKSEEADQPYIIVSVQMCKDIRSEVIMLYSRVTKGDNTSLSSFIFNYF